ncbi:oxygenase MpaB family protein [Tsukamurella sp. 8F]|uniref:oxygenase MpaB family protein n=1 Tax=unclassified Tsukamurella TaxID=2633480 RepID=UPI0023B89476|nr:MULTISPECIES: oxygenase MpaB family protein [unclassified Tsukamurella]MDF0529069.1 oxygenase MpaB family protein [Tsukamurella sp. 8J]MDF0587443.1 oxygenase MpaB family protein [Tsukamurella sp. 8F]
MSRTRRTVALDPEDHFEEIYRDVAQYEFPWDINQALSFALFRTYAVPSIGRLLFETGEFTERVQKRYDDTALLLEAPFTHGMDSAAGKQAIRRINQMHHMYEISNDDMRYVLATFVVIPVRWIERYGWRALEPDEVVAAVRYYEALGRRMGIREIPHSYDDFALLLDEYEAEHFAFDRGGRAVADSTLRLFATFYPGVPESVAGRVAQAIMDPPLLAAFGYDDPGQRLRRLVESGLRARAALVRRLPARRRPKTVDSLRRIRSYPGGSELREMGTFAPGCPVHRTAGRAERAAG